MGFGGVGRLHTDVRHLEYVKTTARSLRIPFSNSECSMAIVLIACVVTGIVVSQPVLKAVRNYGEYKGSRLFTY